MFKYFHEPLYFSNEVIRLQESRQSLFSPRGPSATIATTNPKESQQLRGEIAPFSIVYDFYILLSYPAMPNMTDSSFRSTRIRGNELKFRLKTYFNGSESGYLMAGECFIHEDWRRSTLHGIVLNPVA